MGGSQGATLVVTFSFCPKLLGRWWGPVNDICLFARAVSLVSTLIGGKDTRNVSAIIRIHFVPSLSLEPSNPRAQAR